MTLTIALIALALLHIPTWIAIVNLLRWKKETERAAYRRRMHLA